MRNQNSKSPVSLARYFPKKRSKIGVTREREKVLARRIRKGRTDAFDELVESNIAFVAKIALEYRGLGLSYEDLIHEGCIGLIKAARRFDPDRNTRFISYASFWIRAAIRRALTGQSRTVRIPARQLYLIRQRRAANDARKAPIALFKISLDQKASATSKRAVWETLVEEDQERVDELVIRKQRSEWLGDALDALPEQQRFVIVHRFGLNGEKPQTLQEIGEQLGVSREWVRRLEINAKTRLRRILKRRAWRRK